MASKPKYKPHDGSIKYEINDEKFDVSYMHFDETLYDTFLSKKVQQVKQLFHDFPNNSSVDDMLIEASPTSNYRNRCRFGISGPIAVGSESVRISHTQTPSREHIFYTMWEEGVASVKVVTFPIAVKPISTLMVPLMNLIRSSEEIASELKSVHFLSTQDGQVVISLCYQRPIASSWETAAIEARAYLLSLHLPHVKDVNFIGRSKRVKIIVRTDTVLETVPLRDGRVLRYYQVDDGFSNPNATVNTSVLNWVCDSVQYCNRLFSAQGRHGTNILELFCGNGNHTVAIAGKYRCRTTYVSINAYSLDCSLKLYLYLLLNTITLLIFVLIYLLICSGFASRVVAVELNKSLCEAAKRNLQLNGICNVHVVVGDSQKFAYRVLKNMSYTIVSSSQSVDRDETAQERVHDTSNSNSANSKNLSEKVSETVQFDMILVDPPRCGLDANTRRLIGAYRFILYISCNPEALRRDIEPVSDYIKYFIHKICYFITVSVLIRFFVILFILFLVFIAYGEL